MSDYSTAVLALSPLSYYRMDATSGTTETDLGSDANNLTYHGTYTLNQPGVVPADATSKSVLFGVGDAAASAGTVFGSSATWGIVAWVSSSGLAATAGVIANFGDCGIAHSNSNFSGAGPFLAWYSNSSPSYGVSSTDLPADGRPHMVALIYTAGSIELCLDGTVVLTSSQSITQSTAGGTFVDYDYAPNYFSGEIGDVAFIPGLTLAQVQNLYSIGAAPSPSYSYSLTVITSSANFTTPAASSTLTLYRYRLVAGGGGGGGANGSLAAAGGGAGGGYAEGSFTGVPPNTAIAVTIGSGGSAGSNTGGNGGTGGDSTLALTSGTITAHGGTGGTGSTATAPGTSVGGTGGGASTAAIVIAGQNGQTGQSIASANLIPGAGGSAGMGLGGVYGSGTGYGAGGGGATGTSQTGGLGLNGICVIEQMTA